MPNALNWRKLTLLPLLRAYGNPILSELQFIRDLERQPAPVVEEVQRRRLTALLRHAWENTDYYHEVLGDVGVVRDGRVNLDRFEEIPFLTKDIIRQQGDRLRSRVLPKGAKPYRNSTGGSTGEPIQFWQDTRYWDMNIASKLYRFEVFGKHFGDPELKVWGSSRDLFQGTIGITAKVKNFLYNRRFAQCFHLPEEGIRQIIDEINSFRPKIIWAFRDGIDVVANYINRHGLSVHRPLAVFCGGATIYPEIVQTVSRAFGCPVVNFYGSREMGDVACQCEHLQGLHVASYARKVEVIATDGHRANGADGEIVITALNNYAMPFLRYRTGDVGRESAEPCPCGRGLPTLQSVSGRMFEVLINAKGDRIDPHFFSHLFHTEAPGGLRRFQVIQEDYARLKIKLALEPGASWPHNGDLKLTEKIRRVMGPDCAIDYQIVDDIPLAKSGKHQYILRNIGHDLERHEPRH